jgi:hypothetical protein
MGAAGGAALAVSNLSELSRRSCHRLGGYFPTLYRMRHSMARTPITSVRGVADEPLATLLRAAAALIRGAGNH